MIVPDHDAEDAEARDRPCSGAQSSVEKNSPKETSSKKPIVGVSSEITIAVVVTTEITAQRASRA